MRTKRGRKRIQKVWLVITIIAVLAMVAFTIAPALTLLK
jgi:hypothetical protein